MTFNVKHTNCSVMESTCSYLCNKMVHADRCVACVMY